MRLGYGNIYFITSSPLTMFFNGMIDLFLTYAAKVIIILYPRHAPSWHLFAAIKS